MPTADTTTLADNATVATRPVAAAAGAPGVALDAAGDEPMLDSGVAPLLFVFLVPLLAIVGLVLWIGASLTWLAVGVTMVTIGATTAVVMLAINRLLADGAADH